MSDSVIVIRASSLAGYADCPRRGAARMFRREIEAAGYTLRRLARGIGALAGTATAVIAKVALSEKASTGVLAPLDAALDAGRDQLVADLQDGEVAFDRVTVNRREAIHQVISMGTMYHRTIAPKVNPIQVETRLEAERDGIILSGQADVIAFEPGAIRDLKTGQRPPPAQAQLGAYSLLTRSHGIVDVTEAAIDFVRRVPMTKPQPDPITMHANIADAEVAAVSILQHIAADLRTFREGDPERHIQPGDSWAFLPNPSSILCSAKWCPAHGTDFCREGRDD